MIDSKHLKLIVAVDELGSLNKASRKLNLTQSALSHQLKNLEEYLGIEVFHRIGNQLYFTEAGKELLDRAKVILNDLKNLESKIEEIKDRNNTRYIHGYSQSEAKRLVDQATSVSDYLHYDSVWEDGARVLEVGCGVGAQTVIIAQKNPNVEFVSIDLSEHSLEIARSRVRDLQIGNVDFKLQDIRTISKKQYGAFDHIFVCFLLEHVSNPGQLLESLKTILKPGGTITVIEGDHGSTYFYPDNKNAQKLVHAQVELQKTRGGDPNIGRSLFPLLQKAVYKNIKVNPRQIYVDHSKPELVSGFIKNTFTAMIQGMSEDLLNEELVNTFELEAGIKGLLRTTEKDGVFCYTFFKATATI